MLADLLGWLTGKQLFSYLSFRAAMAAFTAFALAITLGSPAIRWLRAARVQDNVDTSGSEDLAQKSREEGKHKTPTMGGSFLIGSLLLAVLLWADLSSWGVVLGVLLTAGLAAVGFVDDYRKLTDRKSGGLSRGAKMIGLSMVTLGVLAAFVQFGQLTGNSSLLTLYPPLFKTLELDLGAYGAFGVLLFIGFQWFVIVGSSNAANITDGLDGLAVGCILISALALTIFCYVTGRADWTSYLNLPFIPDAGDMAVVGGAVCGACLGFLWFNAYPAQVFMGDSGSLPLGGLLAWMAVVSKQELVLPLIASVLILNLLSSGLQTFWFKRTKKLYGEGRRVFTCAPLHHGLQLYGGVFTHGAPLHEVKVVVRFWILASVAALASLALLKVR